MIGERDDILFQQYVKDLGALLDKVEARQNGSLLSVNQAVNAVLALLCTTHDEGKKLYWIGNGGSAAIAGHSALDYFRTGGFKSLAFHDGPMLTCLGNDFGYPAVFAKPLSLFAEAGDVLFAISSSGRSENILRAADVARDKGCHVIALSGFSSDNPLRQRGEIDFYVPASQYGYVELIHGILCHSFLDLFMAGQHPERSEPTNG